MQPVLLLFAVAFALQAVQPVAPSPLKVLPVQAKHVPEGLAVPAGQAAHEAPPRPALQTQLVCAALAVAFAPHEVQLAAPGPLISLLPQALQALEPPGLEVPSVQGEQVRGVVALPPVAPWPGSHVMKAEHIMLPVPIA